MDAVTGHAFWDWVVIAMGKRPALIEFPEDEVLAGDARVCDEQALVSAATRYLLAHLSQNLSVGELAFLFDVTEKRLSQAFCANLGMTVPKYLLRERMFLAQRLLLQTSLSIGAIANRVGFTYGSHFSKEFRRYFGTTPWEFRNNPPDAAVTAFQGSVLWG